MGMCFNDQSHKIIIFLTDIMYDDIDEEEDDNDDCEITQVDANRYFTSLHVSK